MSAAEARRGRPKEYDRRTNTSVRLDPELHAALKQAAKERELSVNVLVNLAVKELLPRLIPIEELRLTR